MNKHILTIALTGLALTGFSQVATAHEEDEQNQRPDYQQNYDPRGEYQQQAYDPRGDYRQQSYDRVMLILA